MNSTEHNLNLMDTNNGFSIKRILKCPQTSIIIALIILYAILMVVAPSFFNPSNLVNVVRQASTMIIIGIGITFILSAGIIDLSVGSLACMGAIIGSSFLTGQAGGGMEMPIFPLAAAVIVGIVVPALFGSINGLVITKLNLPPFIVTMAMMEAARGIILVFTKGYPVSNLPEKAINIGRGSAMGIPYTVYITIVLLIIFGSILSRTKFGRHVYAVGGNEECARLSGVKVEKVKIILYILNGALAGIAGLLVAFRMASAQISIGETYGMDAITACCLGGTPLGGGKGYMIGTVLGSLFLVSLSTGFNLMGVNIYWQQIIKGVVLVVAIAMSSKEQFNIGKKSKAKQQKNIV